MSPSNGTTTEGVNANGNKNYIEHQVSKTDTLAGVAIKYGVEVSLLFCIYSFIYSLVCLLY